MNMHRRRATPRLGTLALGLFLFATSGQAAVYMERDAEGNIVFTDHPTSPAAKPVELPPPSTYQPPPLPRLQDTQSTPSPTADTGYKSLAIASPPNDEPLRANNGEVDVVVAIDPPLRPGHQLRLLLDGRVVAEGGETHFRLENVDRGTHQLQAEVLDTSGRVVLSSPVSTFHLLRYHPPVKAP